jgi:cell wall-associated NlpC family hydrolase
MTMQPYFNSVEKILQLDTEARSWLGTPFAPKAMVKGAGVDCVHLVAGILLAVGALKEFTPGNYSLDEGNHLKESKVIGWFANHHDFSLIDNPPFVTGDVLCFNLALVGHHVGLIIGDGHIIHALPKRQVMLADPRESFYTRHIVATYRLMKGAS